MTPDYEIRDRQHKRRSVKRQHIQPSERPPHPSVIVQREAEARGMSAQQVQDTLGWPDSNWSAFGNQTFPMRKKHHNDLARVFGPSAAFWREVWIAWRCWEPPWRESIVSTAYYHVQDWVGHVLIDRTGDIVNIVCAHGTITELEVFTSKEVATRVLFVLADREAGAVMTHIGGEGGQVFLSTRGDDLPADMQVISEHGELFTVAQVRAMTSIG